MLHGEMRRRLSVAGRLPVGVDADTLCRAQLHLACVYGWGKGEAWQRSLADGLWCQIGRASLLTSTGGETCLCLPAWLLCFDRVCRPS